MTTRIRPATLADLSTVHQLIARCQQTDYDEVFTTPDDLRRQWESPRFDRRQRTALITRDDTTPIAYAALQPYDATTYGLDLYLQPQMGTSRMGERLVAHLMGPLRDRANQTKITLISRVSERNATNQAILAQHSFQRSLSFLIMRATLDKPPPTAQWLAGFTIRTFVSGQDEQSTYEADEAAAQDKGYHSPLCFADWSQRMGLNTPRFDPSLWFLAETDGEIAGVALNFYLVEQEIGLIDHLGVKRPFRRRGLGLALLRHSLTQFYARGISQVQLSVDSGSLTNAPRLYEKAGFRTTQQYHIYKKGIGQG